MKKILFILFALILTAGVSAQSATDARNILDKAVNTYQQSNGVKIIFKATIKESKGQAYSQSGTAIFKGNKFKIETDAMNTWFDGKTQWVWMKDADEVNISNPTEQEIAAISPLALLGMYKNGYTLKAPVSKNIHGKNTDSIDMTPTTKSNEFKAISVAIDKKTGAIVQVNLTMKNGTTTKIDISNYNANHNFSDSDFVFDKSKHPKTEVIDLR